MALAHYDLATGALHQAVYGDPGQSDDELEAVFPIPAGCAVLRFKGTFKGTASWDQARVQALIDEERAND